MGMRKKVMSEWAWLAQLGGWVLWDWCVCVFVCVCVRACVRVCVCQLHLWEAGYLHNALLLQDGIGEPWCVTVMDPNPWRSCSIVLYRFSKHKACIFHIHEVRCIQGRGLEFTVCELSLNIRSV